MKKLQEILNHPLYVEHSRAIEAYEVQRQFCGHDYQHFLDVARIGYIYVLEQGIDVSKEVVYGYAFLHDIGRDVEYSGGQSHDLASVKVARSILKDTLYTKVEQEQIISAIEHHRNKSLVGQKTFEGLMYKADKASRACYACPARSQCHWDDNKKNMTVEV